jgi:hypothetical protein
MAQFLLVSVLVHTPPTSSDLVANDVIDVYWDDTTSAIVVKKNSVVWGGSVGGYFGDLGTNYHISGITSYEGEYAISGYSFCSSTDLKWFRMLISYPYHPFMEQRTTTNSPVCAIGGGAVCDIAFSGAPTITHATDLSTGGSFTVTATSSNGTVKYSLSNTDYASMTDTTGTFTGLAPGTWTVYAKDTNDCTAQVTVRILFKPSEVEHYRFSWSTSKIGAGTTRDARIRIYEREYVGSVVKIDYGNVSPFMLNKPKQGEVNNKFYPIHPTNATIDLTSVEVHQFLPLFTQDNKKYRVVYEVFSDGAFSPVWQGFIDPNIYREDFVSTPYFVEIQVVDNLKILESELFTDNEGNLLFGSMKLIKVINLIMQKTGLSLKIRSGINIFEANHTTLATDDPLDQTYIDVACYRRGSEPFTCWEVLEAILKPFGARILQEQNMWIIEEVDRATDNYNYRIFDTAGDYESNGTTTGQVVDVKAPTLTSRAALANQDHSLEVVPAYGKITLTSQLNYIGSIVAGGFEKEDLLSPESETFSTANGVFTSEEGFKDWTLRQPTGISGVSFGRVVAGRRGDSARTGLKTEDEDPTRSVGAMFYNFEQWGGNLRNAYIESSAKPYQYGPNDEFNFKFKYSTPAKPEFPFMVLRFVIKLGTNYLQQDLTWGATEHIYRAYPPVTNSLQQFELGIPLPETTVIVDTTVQVRIYFYASEFYDYGLPPATTDPVDGVDGQSDLRALATVGIDYDYRLDFRYEKTTGSVTNYSRAFAELRYSQAAHDPDAGVIRPNDFDATTNPKIWSSVGSVLENNPVGNRRGIDRKFYLDDIALDALINGQPPPEEDIVSLQISKYINENLEVDLYNFDVPDIVNAKNMYNNYFRLSNGAPTALWTRTGVAESLSLQQILLKVLGANHSAPTFRMTGTFINEFSRIAMNNYIRITKTGSNLIVSNSTFTSNLDGWTNDGTTEPSFAWSADNSGSAEVDLTGTDDSKKLYQTISHSGGYIEVTMNVNAVPSAGNTREDVLWLLFYVGSDIVHTEKMKTFNALTSTSLYQFTHIAHCPKNVNRIGFYFKRVSGTGTISYQVGEFNPAGKDILEVYQIADFQGDERLNTYQFELMQMSKTYISLSAIDSGGTNQSGGTTGRAHSSGHSSGFN